jgi:hypothetical protein
LEGGIIGSISEEPDYLSGYAKLRTVKESQKGGDGITFSYRLRSKRINFISSEIRRKENEDE